MPDDEGIARRLPTTDDEGIARWPADKAAYTHETPTPAHETIFKTRWNDNDEVDLAAINWKGNPVYAYGTFGTC